MFLRDDARSESGLNISVKENNIESSHYSTYSMEESSILIKNGQEPKEDIKIHAKREYPTYSYEETFSLINSCYDPRNFPKVKGNKEKQSKFYGLVKGTKSSG